MAPTKPDGMMEKVIAILALAILGVDGIGGQIGSGGEQQKVSEAIGELGKTMIAREERMAEESRETRRELGEAVKTLVVAVERIAQLDRRQSRAERRIDETDSRLEKLETAAPRGAKK